MATLALSVTSPFGLWTPVLKPRVWHYGRCHLGFLETEVTLFGRGYAMLRLYPDWIWVRTQGHGSDHALWSIFLLVEPLFTKWTWDHKSFRKLFTEVIRSEVESGTRRRESLSKQGYCFSLCCRTTTLMLMTSVWEQWLGGMCFPLDRRGGHMEESF